MTDIKRNTIDNTIEHQICTAMITSEQFLTKIRSVYVQDYIKNSFAKIVCAWCVDYYDVYKKEPGRHIQDIYLLEKSQGLPDEDAEIIKVLLERLSNDFAEGQSINSDYVLDNALQYFKKRELEIRVEKAKGYLSLGKIQEAEDQFTRFKKVAYTTTNWFNPLDPKEIFEVFDDREEGFFQLPGALGDIVGKLERDWFVAVIAPFKRGKTWFLQEMAVRAMFQRLKVVFISLEMKKKTIKERLYKRITGFGSKTGDDSFLYPVFDCLYNQLNECTKPERTNDVRLRDRNGNKPEWDIDIDYKPCSYCRDHMLQDYALETWYEQLEIPHFAFSNTKKTIEAFQMMYGDNLRCINYPRFSASVTDLRRDLFLLEQQEGFIPDIVIVDYADILKPEGGGEKDVKKTDNIWKELGGMASEIHCILFTASQGTRGSIYKSDLGQDDLAEWIGKLGHVDLFLALNQTGDEKTSKVLRVSALVHRHKECDERVAAMVLQQLEVGQFAIDSEIVRRRA